MSKNNLNQRNKIEDLLIKPKFNYENEPINRFEKVEIIENRLELLNKLKLKIENLNNCELKNYASKIVFSDGNEESPIMIIGEGPGQKEDELGKPFVGDAGILLNKMLSAINLDRKDIYITNVVNYRPPSNRKPELKEIKRYSKYLYEHVEIIDPKIIVLLGSTAMEAFFGPNLKITKERGTWKEILIKNKTFPTMITFHPAYLLRQADQKKYSWIDLKEIRKKIEELKIHI
tara:strand:- start:379 stop:1074 length:696 start_codon:yes stop_codon:yes gene_type:complete